MQTAFFITARLKSIRLPKKIILEVAGKPLLVHMIDRIKNAQSIDKIVICTSTHPQDDPLEKIANQQKVKCFRGSEDDVLVRLRDAARAFSLQQFANITADCPMIDPVLIDRAVADYYKFGADLVMYDDSHEHLPFNCYVVRSKALESICIKKQETDTEVWLKHFLYDPKINIHAISVEEEYRHSSLKTSIDYREDYEFIKRVFLELYSKNDRTFSMLDLLELIKKKPELIEINANPVLLNRWRKHQHAIS